MRFFVVAITLLLIPATACGGPPDLATDDGVRAAFKKATGKDLHEDDCIGRPGVKDVVVVGSFAHDRGCDLDGGFVGGTWMDRKAMGHKGLAALGWAEMDAKARAELATQWSHRVLYHWGGSVVRKTEKAFELEDTPAFTAPSTATDGDAVLVTFWVEEPPGMQDIDIFEQVELRFAADGAITRSKKGSFSVDGSRVRGR